ncbi:MAG: Ig-like domain-containing protein, partial [Crocosphaera sp.]
VSYHNDPDIMRVDFTNNGAIDGWGFQDLIPNIERAIGKTLTYAQLAETPGVFTVDAPKIVIDFLADGGGFHNELAIVSLEGMENIVPGSVDFIREAARRALSQSELGYIVIGDANEAARFYGELGEVERNDGIYQGQKTFSMKPGSLFIFMLVPHGTIQDVFNNPNLNGSQKPLFSWALANPNQAIQMGQLVEGLFGFEDILAGEGSDRDYNDLLIYIRGVTGEAPALESLIDPSNNWLNSSLVQTLIETATNGQNFINIFEENPDLISLSLLNDSGISQVDKITYEPTIEGIIRNLNEINRLEAGINRTDNLVDIVEEVQPDGKFTLNRQRLEEIYGDQLLDGTYTLILKATDEHGYQSEFYELTFTLDTTAPETVTNLSLDNNQLDNVTHNNQPTLTGIRENDTQVQLFNGDELIAETVTQPDIQVIDEEDIIGEIEITNSVVTPSTSLPDDSYQITAKTIDLAGNISESSSPLSLTVDTLKPILNITNPVVNSQISSETKLTGTVEGTGSPITTLSYQFNENEEQFIPIDEQGNFEHFLDLSHVSKGLQNLTITATDQAHNKTSISLLVDLKLT